ncbi:MAG TPA: AAA family ATPase [Caulobacteraceae bacterium]
MHFTKLRLSGFKSFVEPTEFRIEPGLTGVVGPNGCGKSNLLEALRWVMGAASAKAMRGDGMDDVIFSGSGVRGSRNHAEVTLWIDNFDRTAPARFNEEASLEVSRRIDRGEGSTYRVNGTEVRARDVQLLFADASTGANSPALVRQGQISELIAAKPENRRRILEEAAGVSGLHGRRHEAQLRVRAAQINLARLEDLSRELEANLARLRREARAAERYKALASEIRALRNAVLHARWSEIAHTLEKIEAEASAASLGSETLGRSAAAAAAAAIQADAAIRPLRDRETAAAAVLHRLAIDSDRLERELADASAEAARRVAEIARIDADAGRESQIVDDSTRALARLDGEIAEVDVQVAAAPQHLPQLRADAEAAEGASSAAQGEVESLASRLATLEAQGSAAQNRHEEAVGRLTRTVRALAQARAERGALALAAGAPTGATGVGRVAAAQTLAGLRSRVEVLEADAAAAAGAEVQSRAQSREAEDRLAQLLAEARGLAQLAAGPSGPAAFPPALDRVSPQPGLEAALAAALGDDLEAALDPRASAHWAGREAGPPAWPAGAEPLGPMIAAPPQLAARLAFTALVERADGPRLQSALPPGGRLVSRQGDLWRWDGYTVRADATRPAQARLEQKARLASVEAEVKALRPRCEAARAAHGQAVQTLASADEAVRTARTSARAAEEDAELAREDHDREARDSALREAQAASLDDTIRRFEADEIEARAACEVAAAAVAQSVGDEDLAGRLAQARAAAASTREAASGARAALDIELRDEEGRRRRLEDLRAERSDWSQRARTAARRQGELASDRAAAEAALADAEQAPTAAQARREELLDHLDSAEAQRSASAEALAAAESARAQADRDARAAESAAAEAREARASLAARLDGARERLAEIAREIPATTGFSPQDLGVQLAGDRLAPVGAIADAETRLARLELERDAVGPVNLRAEEDAIGLADRVSGLRAERADLGGALSRLTLAIGALNSEGRERLGAAFAVIDGHFRTLFTTLFEGGQAELRLVESEDPLEAGLEIFACPPGKRMAVMSLMSGGEQALTAVALIFAVFLANPAPICVLDEVDAPLDDANVERFCNLLAEMCSRAPTRFVAITHNPLTMSRMDRLFGVTMSERGVSQLVSVDLRQAEALAAQ